MRIRKVSADVLEPVARSQRRELSPREQKRRSLESKLDRAIRQAAQDGNSVFRLDLEDEKPATVRLALKRVRDKVGAEGVNLFTRDGSLIIAKRPQSRGRRRS